MATGGNINPIAYGGGGGGTSERNESFPREKTNLMKSYL